MNYIMTRIGYLFLVVAIAASSCNRNFSSLTEEENSYQLTTEAELKDSRFSQRGAWPNETEDRKHKAVGQGQPEWAH